MTLKPNQWPCSALLVAAICTMAVLVAGTSAAPLLEQELIAEAEDLFGYMQRARRQYPLQMCFAITLLALRACLIHRYLQGTSHKARAHV